MPTSSSKGALLIRPVGDGRVLERVKAGLTKEAASCRTSTNQLVIAILDAHVAGRPLGQSVDLLLELDLARLYARLGGGLPGSEIAVSLVGLAKRALAEVRAWEASAFKRPWDPELRADLELVRECRHLARDAVIEASQRREHPDWTWPARDLADNGTAVPRALIAAVERWWVQTTAQEAGS